MTVHVLGGGAVKGLVTGLQDVFASANAATIEGAFSAVGTIRERFEAGEPCDVLILTDPLIDELASSGRLLAGSARPIGVVHAAVAVPTGQPHPDIATPDALRASLLRASALYVPDTLRSTAGRHVLATLRALGIAENLAPRLREFANGETAMRALATDGLADCVGCTQNTEILSTEGLDLVGVLPAAYGLATTYTAAVSASAADPTLALTAAV